MKITDLFEAPIDDYQTIGDMEKNSSFKKPRDRQLITNPKTIEHVKKKFASTDHVFNLYFVNSPKGNRVTEVGEVSMDWVRENLGDEVADTIKVERETTTVIFTNNKGTQGVPMTAWIMAHRIAHVLRRTNKDYVGASDALVHETSIIFDILYGMSDFPDSDSKLTAGGRRAQLLFKHFWSTVCTFKSARDNKVRDWFEIINELFAQYITTGSLKFNELPMVFGTSAVSGRTRFDRDSDEMQEAQDTLSNMIDYLEMEFDRAMSMATGKIWVM